MSTEVIDDQLAELQHLLSDTSCQLLRAQLEQCREHIDGLLASRRYLTSTFVKKSAQARTPDARVIRKPSKASPEQRNIDSPDYETLQYRDSWDQSGKFVKLYLTVAGLTADDPDKVTCSFSDRGLDLWIQDVDGTNYKLEVDNLTHRIKIKDSKYRLKDGCLVLFLSKAILNQRWADITKKPFSAFIDHYGRSQLKTFLHEHQLIKASKMYQAENNPLASYIRQLMTSQGYYDITDVATAKSALSSFERLPPLAALVSLGLLKKSHCSLLTDLVTAVASHPCVVMVTCPGFIRPDEQEDMDSETLGVLVNGRCELTHFSGRISPADFARLPATLYKMGVGVAGAEDAAAVAKMTLPENLQTFGVSVSRGVQVEDLRALPVIKNPYQLFFSDVTDDDVEWVIGCLNKMIQQRVCWLHLPNSALSPTGLMLLWDKLFNENWIQRRNQEQFTMQNTGLAPLNPFVFVIPPPPKPTAPILGLHPLLNVPVGVVFGVLGLAVDVTNWTQHARSYVQQQYRSFGCQLKWSVDWHWTDAM